MDSIASTPRPPYTAVIFTSVEAQDLDGYAEMADRMFELAALQPGYLGVESARKIVGITVSYWATEADAVAWKRVVEHSEAQRIGRERWYARYRVRVATVTRDYGSDPVVRIVGVCGSLQTSSSNLTLLQAVPTVAPIGVEFSIFDGVRDLPLFDPDLERDGAVPNPVARWRSVVAGADALLIASPEYGHSLPGSLKNAIDWVIGSGELEGKIVGVTASVNHEARGQKGLAAVLTTLMAVSANVIGGTAIARGPNEVAELRTLVTALAAVASRDTVSD